MPTELQSPSRKEQEPNDLRQLKAHIEMALTLSKNLHGHNRVTPLTELALVALNKAELGTLAQDKAN